MARVEASLLCFGHWEEDWDRKTGLDWPGYTCLQEASGQWGWVMIILQSGSSSQL